MKLNSNKRYSYQPSYIFINNKESNIIKSLEETEKNELNEILHLMVDESNTYLDPPYKGVKKLNNYIRRNRNSIEDTIIRLNEFIKNISNENLIINIVKIMIDLENEGINRHLNDIIDILINKLENMPQLSPISIEKIVNIIGELIKLDNISLQNYLENKINQITSSITVEQRDTKNENSKFYNILLLSKIIENCSLFAYNIITNEKNFRNFQKIIRYFKDPKIIIKYAVGELIKQFNHILKNRDYESKSKYQIIIFDIIFSEYRNFQKEYYPEVFNINLILGIFIILRNLYCSEPLILIKNENIYSNLIGELSKCLNSRYNSIKKIFIKFVPELYEMNKEIFTKQYLNKFLEEINKYLNVKSNNEIRNALLVTLGYFSLYIKKETFKICLKNLTF